MGLYDRDYTHSGYRSSNYGSSGGMGMLRPPRMIMRLLIINGIIFLLSMINPIGNFIEQWFSVVAFKGDFVLSVSLWRYITYQFLHSRIDFSHIIFNMLWLYFLGPMLERAWGEKKFITFYLLCGVAGGMLYQILVQVGWLQGGYLVGASGAILGLLSACAILYPAMKIYLLFMPFGIPIRVFAIASTILYFIFVVKQSSNAGGDAAHLAGMAAGAFYVLWGRYSGTFQKVKLSVDTKNERKILEEVDRILDKVSRDGIDSLSRREKNILKEATKLEQKK